MRTGLKSLKQYAATNGMSYSSLWRWSSEGVKTRAGQVFLRCEQYGTRRYTCAEWVREFGEAVAAGNQVERKPAVVVDAERAARVEAAVMAATGRKTRLQKAGV